jgi:sugar (pentulose or hexulose) kinase
MKPWFLGIDLGTGNCTSVVTDERAQVLGFGSGSYAKAGSQHQWQEQDPEALITGMVHSVKAAIQKAG